MLVYSIMTFHIIFVTVCFLLCICTRALEPGAGPIFYSKMSLNTNTSETKPNSDETNQGY